MSTSLLYQAFGIRGYRYCHTRYEDGATIFHIRLPRSSFLCAACGHAHVHVVERFRRAWRAESIGSRPVWIEMLVPKVECKSCGASGEGYVGGKAGCVLQCPDFFPMNSPISK